MEYLKTDPEFLEREDDNECETSDGSAKSYIDYDGEDQDEEDDNDDEGDDDGESSDQPDSFLGGVDFDYMAEAVKLLENHAEVSTDNALIVNRRLQDMLETLRRKVVSMLNKCREKYVENQEKLANPTHTISLLKGIGSCGAPFFKDACGKRCPPNADYIYRREIEKELFPIDLELFPHFVWTATDKLGILQGIKEQAIEHIERKASYPSTSSGKNNLSKNVKLHSMKLKELLVKVDDEFSIDWNQISVYNLKSRHTANSCYAIWNVYLKPEINRNEWTEEENLKLNSLAKKYKFQDWIAIAAEMKGRSDYQCFVQYQTVVSIRMREDKGERWTKEEDFLLLTLVEKHRMGNVIRWNPICSQLPNRTKKQCFARYKYSINPSILRAPFTPEEDCIILAAVEEYGENFNCFPKALFPNRTIVQIRNRYYNSIKTRENVRSWTPEDDKILLHLVSKHGSHNWKKIAEEIHRHSRTSCRTRFFVISKFLKDNPNATIKDLPRKNRGPLSSVTKGNWMNKIAEIKQNPFSLVEAPSAKKPRKECYRFRLRNNELKWYNYLKYSYDFTFGSGYSKVPDSMKSLEFVRIVLDAHFELPIVLEKPYTTGVVRVNLEKLLRTTGENNKIIINNTPSVGYRLPPNYCSLLAFRGLCIMTSFQEVEPTSTPAVTESDRVREAKEKFRQRLISLFYKTTLLSRLDPAKVVEQSNFEIIFDPETLSGRNAKRSLAELKVAQTNVIAENIAIATRKAKRKRETNLDNLSSPPSTNKQQKKIVVD